MPNGYAVCPTHVEDAINWAIDRKLAIRVRLAVGDELMSCHCKKQAAYYLYEVMPGEAAPRDVLDMS